jgi:hypothetical protein
VKRGQETTCGEIPKKTTCENDRGNALFVLLNQIGLKDFQVRIICPNRLKIKRIHHDFKKSIRPSDVGRDDIRDVVLLICTQTLIQPTKNRGFS